MRVLVISRNAWDDTNAIGNTISNFFAGIDDIEFASIYFRSAHPNNTLCNHYYRTSEAEVLKKWFSKEKIGKEFFTESSKVKKQTEDKAGNKEKTFIRVIQKHGLKLVYKLSDALWYSGKWMNENLKNFVESFAPDVVFSFVKSAPQYYLTVKYLRENFDIPLLSWIADDEYTGLLKSNSEREIQNLKYILNESSVVLGCSREICDYYNDIFDCDARVLYKGCDLSTQVKDSVNTPIKIVYAGNLLYGRLEIIKKITEIFEQYSDQKNKVNFRIYSNTLLLESEIQDSFDGKICTEYMGKKDYDTIKKELAASDIVLHVESFDESEILKTKYSFSTKIIDCLQSGGVLLSVGPKGLASIEYVRKIPGACVIDNLHMLREQLTSILDDSSDFPRRAKAIREFAHQNHDCHNNSETMQRILKEIVGEGS